MDSAGALRGRCGSNALKRRRGACFASPGSFKELREPRVDIFGAAMLSTAPDFGEIVVASIVVIVLYGVVHVIWFSQTLQNRKTHATN
jgi:hypothetical protein